ncbi:gamma-butyrobetaine hydroxylase [Phlegmacium glaucopus]|nr:gamma-butyrobetaine hydroxylase [Phlegmacium glaucopus]
MLLVKRAGYLRTPFIASRTPWHWQTRTWTTYTQTTNALTIHALNNISFPYIWLRDSCQSSECIHQNSKQKLHRSSDIPLNIVPTEQGVKVTSSGIDITWNDGHKSSFDQAFLQRHASTSKLMEWHLDQHLTEEAWTLTSISNLPNLFIPYDKINTPSGLVEAITQLSKYGLLFVSGVPNQETSHGTCELRPLAERFGEIRQTFYGPLWDVVNLNNDSRNIAYTNLALGLHMDLLYFQHPPRYQILHCLRNQVIGGTSIFVDALHVARQLRESHPADFDILTKTPVAFHYVVDGHHLHREHFTIELAPPSIFSTSSSSELQISHINYSPPFQAPLPLNTPIEFYPALARFAEMLDDPMNTYKYTLKEGDAVLFDNRRVLHARTAFRDKPGVEMKQGEINRWLKGCYLEADALVDRVRVLRAKLENGAPNH